MSTGELAPRPGAAPAVRMVGAHARFELVQLLRNGEQLLLTVVIPTLLLVLFSDPISLPRLHELDAAMAQLEGAGVRIIALSMAKSAEASARAEPELPHLSIAETDPETIDAYSLFRRTPSVEGVPAMPAHMEFLIDRQGYLRYRWSPAFGAGWDRMTELVKRVDSLNREPPRPPAPEGHVH